MAEEVDEISIDIGKEQVVEDAVDRVKEQFNVDLAYGSQSENKRWIILYGKPEDRRVAMDYLKALCNPGEVVPMNYPVDLHMIMTNPKILSKLEAQSKTAILIKNIGELNIHSMDSLGVALAMSAIEDLITKYESEGALNIPDLPNPKSAPSRQSSARLDKELQRFSLEDKDLVYDENYATLPDSVKRTLLGWFQDDKDKRKSDDGTHKTHTVTSSEAAQQPKLGQKAKKLMTPSDFEASLSGNFDNNASGSGDVIEIESETDSIFESMNDNKRLKDIAKKRGYTEEETEAVFKKHGYDIATSGFIKALIEYRREQLNKEKQNKEDDSSTKDVIIVEESPARGASVNKQQAEASSPSARKKSNGSLTPSKKELEKHRPYLDKLAQEWNNDDQGDDLEKMKQKNKERQNLLRESFNRQMQEDDELPPKKTGKKSKKKNKQKGKATEVIDLCSEEDPEASVMIIDEKSPDRGQANVHQDTDLVLPPVKNKTKPAESYANIKQRDQFMDNSKQKEKDDKGVVRSWDNVIIQRKSGVKNATTNNQQPQTSDNSNKPTRNSRWDHQHNPYPLPAPHGIHLANNMPAQRANPAVNMPVPLLQLPPQPGPYLRQGAPRNGRQLRPIVIDGSNIAMHHANHKYFSCKGIEICINYFKKRGHKEITAFVPQWRTRFPTPANPIQDQPLLERLRVEGTLVFTPARRVPGKNIVCYDDNFVVRLAKENDGIVVTNDNYRDLWNDRPDWREVIEKRLLPFSFVGDLFMPPDDPLGRDGPNLDEFLCKPAFDGNFQGNKPSSGNAAVVPPLMAVNPYQQQVPAPLPLHNPWGPLQQVQQNFPNPQKQQQQHVRPQKPPAQNFKTRIPLRKSEVTKQLRDQLIVVFSEDSKDKIDRILENHPDETDINKLSDYVIAVLAD